MRNLCLAGGVALNCVATGKVLRDARSPSWIQPAQATPAARWEQRSSPTISTSRSPGRR